MLLCVCVCKFFGLATFQTILFNSKSQHSVPRFTHGTGIYIHSVFNYKAPHLFPQPLGGLFCFLY